MGSPDGNMSCWQIHHGNPKDHMGKTPKRHRHRLVASPACIPPVLCRCRREEESVKKDDGIWLMVAWPSESPVVVSLLRTYKKSRVDSSSQHSAMFVASQCRLVASTLTDEVG